VFLKLLELSQLGALKVLMLSCQLEKELEQAVFAPVTTELSQLNTRTLKSCEMFS